MPDFSERSKAALRSCDTRLQALFDSIVRDMDCTVIQGHRSHPEQLKLFAQGASKVKDGKHNLLPSLAVDVAPYVAGRGIPWPQRSAKTYIQDLCLYYYFAGWVLDRAKHLGMVIRWGGDWDRDHDIGDQSFNDLVHFELMDET